MVQRFLQLAASWRADASRTPIAEGLRELGLWGLGSHEKFIPATCTCKPTGWRASTSCAGLLDTDGWVEKWGSVRFCTSSYRLATDVVELVRSLGGWCTLERQAHVSYTYQR